MNLYRNCNVKFRYEISINEGIAIRHILGLGKSDPLVARTVFENVFK